jgi:hypothetical protein
MEINQDTGSLWVWLGLTALALIGSGALFPEGARRAVLFIGSIGQGARAVIEILAGLIERSITWLWAAVRPPTPVSPLGVLVGLTLLAMGGGVAVANYHVTSPTLHVLIPFESGRNLTAFTLVAFTSALGVLMHFATGTTRRLSIVGCELLLVSILARLAWVRAIAVQIVEGLPLDLTEALSATVLAVFLQVADFTVFCYAFILASEAIAVVVALPAFVLLGVVWLGLHLLRASGLDNLLAGLAETLVACGEASRRQLSRLAHACTPEARRQRRHQRDVADLSRQSELAQLRSTLDTTRDDEAWVRARAMEARQTVAAHERKVAATVAHMDEVLVAQLTKTMTERGATLVNEVIDRASEHLRVRMAEESELSAPGVAKDLSAFSFPSRALDMLRRYTGRSNPGRSNAVN